MTTAVPIIDLNSEDGKNFLSLLEKLKKTLNLNASGEKVRQHKELTNMQFEENPFLVSFMKSDAFKHFQVKKVAVGNFGRKAGYNYGPITDNLFRIFIHIGDNEVYYLSDENVKDKMIPLSHGEGFIVSGFSSGNTNVTVYPDPLRIIHNSQIQSKIPKIRPRNYSRTTLVYDVYFDVDPALLEENQKTEKQQDENNPENQVPACIEDCSCHEH